LDLAILPHYQQAVCYRKNGIHTQAVQRYKQFLSMWKEADPDLAQVKEARRQVELLPKRMNAISKINSAKTSSPISFTRSLELWCLYHFGDLGCSG
jgi:hypothetical protein